MAGRFDDSGCDNGGTDSWRFVFLPRQFHCPTARFGCGKSPTWPQTRLDAVIVAGDLPTELPQPQRCASAVEVLPRKMGYGGRLVIDRLRTDLTPN